MGGLPELTDSLVVFSSSGLGSQTAWVPSTHPSSSAAGTHPVCNGPRERCRARSEPEPAEITAWGQSGTATKTAAPTTRNGTKLWGPEGGQNHSQNALRRKSFHPRAHPSLGVHNPTATGGGPERLGAEMPPSLSAAPAENQDGEEGSSSARTEEFSAAHPSSFQTLPTPRPGHPPLAAPALQRTDLSGGRDGEDKGGNRGAAQIEESALGDSSRSLQRAELAPKTKPNPALRQAPPLPPTLGQGTTTVQLRAAYATRAFKLCLSFP